MMDGSKPRILLVDDDESLRCALQKTLEKIGYDVTPAADGKAGLELFEEAGRFGVVISDIRMPKMDGLELTRRIRALGTTPVILITGFSELLETRAAHELGANEFLPKPFERQDLERAIERCLSCEPPEGAPDEYCKLAIADFLCGRQILFNIFLRLSDQKYVKIAHKGEDLSIDRIHSYKEKGVHYLYLLRDDFRKYLGFSLKITRAAQRNPSVSREKRLQLARHTADVILSHIESHGLDSELFDDAFSFVETMIDAISDDEALVNLLEALKNHSDYHYSHGVGVSFYSVAMAKQVGWGLPTNRFKVALGGLIHDIGEKEIGLDVLAKPRSMWSLTEVKLFEGHPSRGVEILNGIQSIPEDVLQIVKHHHEDCMAQGFPSRLRRSHIHPMAKLISVADLFCELAIPNPNSPGVPPADALLKMATLHEERLDKQFFGALKQLFARAHG